jgi:D-threonate/D-erythronate kinase
VTVRPFIVLADDRTGAWETAGAWADRIGGPVAVHVGTTFPVVEHAVIDLGTRHVRPEQAAAIAAEATTHLWSTADRLLHKIDSTLRGNWADEIVGAAAVHRRPVVIVPAFPAVGRTCREGIVFDGDEPVHAGPAGRDPRRRVTMSRPAEHLAACHADPIVAVRDAHALERWLASSPTGIAVCDASTDDDVERLGSVWANHGHAVFAGTAASIAAALGHGSTAAARNRTPPLDVPALVVCGSLHPAARRQLEALRQDPMSTDVEIIVSDENDGRTITENDANAVAAQLADAVSRIPARREFATIVILGGDSASAILGDSPRRIHGTVGPGMPWTLDENTVIVTRPGGFGSDRSLIELFSTRMEP